jgi:hypothetical protein
MALDKAQTFFVVAALLIKAKQQHGKIKTKLLVCV